MKSRNKLLIVDGYNVLRSGSRYRALRDLPDYTDDVLNRSRETLLNDVIAYAGRDYRRAILVFDGGGNEFSDGSSEKIGGVDIIFSPAGSSADKVIEKLAHDAREKHVEVMVVTSDATIQDTVFGGGVDRMSAEGFSREMDTLAYEAHEEKLPEISEKSTVSQRISKSSATALRKLRDQLQDL